MTKAELLAILNTLSEDLPIRVSVPGSDELLDIIALIEMPPDAPTYIILRAEE